MPDAGRFVNQDPIGLWGGIQKALLEKLGVPKENILSGKKIYLIERCSEEYQSCGTNYLEKYTR